MLTVVTGWGPNCWDDYAHRFAETFREFWPAGTPCIAYVERPVGGLSGIEQRLLLDIPGCIDFLQRHEGNEEARGIKPNKKWRPKHIASGYNFRFDALKFFRQGYIPLDAAFDCKTEFLAWFDADVIFTAPVTPERVVGMMPSDKCVAYLGRPPFHSEIGFQLYRLPGALPHLQEFRDLYDSDRVFGLGEYHSAFVFDEALARSGVAAHNMTPNGKGDVWLQSPLRAFSAHLKGRRKYRR